MSSSYSSLNQLIENSSEHKRVQLLKAEASSSQYEPLSSALYANSLDQSISSKNLSSFKNQLWMTKTNNENIRQMHYGGALEVLPPRPEQNAEINIMVDASENSLGAVLQ